MEEDCCATQLIYGDGKFNADGLDRFVKEVKLAECGLSYGVVGIVGPQSSGKSILQNHLFNTKFREMNANSGRSQTTKDIWIAKCVGIKPCTIAMDLEGTVGRERGQDATAFEKQSTLFALAVSDIVLINIKGYSNYAPIINAPQPQLMRQEMFKRSLDEQDKPFLETFFQVMMRFSIPCKTTLLFVIHDNSKTPFQHWHPGLRKFMLNLLFGTALEEIWNGVPKPQAHKSTRFSDFFSEEVVVLSSYEEKEKFKEEVAQLRQRISRPVSQGGFAGDRRGVVPASGFSLSAQQIWKVIKENKDLDLPAHKGMVATVRCEEIANHKFNQLIYDKGWLELEKAVQTGPVQNFGRRLSSILGTYLSEYDVEAIYFEECARNSKRQLLESKALDFVYPAYTTMLGHVRSKALEDFKVRLAQSLNKGEGFASYVRTCTHSSMLEFDKGCADAAIQQSNWDASRVLEKLKHDIDAHTSSVCIAKLSELNVIYEKQLSASLIGPIGALLETGGKNTWGSIRKLLQSETEIAVSKFSTAVAEFELGKERIAGMLQHLRDYSRNVGEKKTREEATKIMIHMKDRFSRVLSYDSDSKPRVWTGKEDTRSITKDARSASLNLLSVMAAIRLDEKPDNIEKVLFSSLMDGTVTVSSSQDKRTGASVDPLGSSTWEEVSSKDTLITPVQCKSLWRQFIAETENSVTQAISALVMVATVRCEEIANQKFNQLISDKGWLALEGAVQIGGVQGFGKRLSSILSTYLSEYDIEAINFDKGARNSKRQLLESKALDHVYPAYTTMLGHVRSKALEEFKVRLAQLLNKGEGFASYVRTCTHSSMLEFDNGCADAAIQQANWDASGVREKLKQDIDAHASSVCIAKLSELNVNYEKQLAASLIGPIEALLETGEKDTWASIRKLLNIALSKFSTAVAEFELGKEKIAGMLQHLRDYSRNVVEKKAREEATKIMIHMKDRFSRVLSYDSDSKPRVWTGKEDIRSITKDARSASLNLLSVMAAIRLDEKPDNIEKVLFSSLMDGTVTVSSSQDKRTGASVDPLGSSTWEEVSSKDTLITPVQCKSLWRQFIAETENSVTQAISALVMVATVRCEEIANQKFNQLISDKGWLALEGAVQIGGVQGFGKRLSSILSTYLSEYDIEAINFDKGARNSKRQLLESKALDHVYPAYTTMLGHVRSKALEEFKVRLAQLLNKGEGFASYVRTCTHSSMLEFDNGCADAAIQQANWDASGVREKLKQDIDAHASSVCIAKLSELNVNYEKQLAASLIGPIEALLETGEKDTWASIRKLLNIALSKFSTAVAEFELGKEKIAGMLQHLRDYSRNVVEKKAREEATKIMIHMKDRFSRVLSYDSDSKPRVWTGKEDIRSITKDARSASLNLLSVMAAIRLDEKPDNIEKVLFSSLMDGTVTVSSSQDKRTGASVDPLGSSTWEEVSSKDTLITPVQCKSLWRQFIAETENSVTQAISALVMVATVRCEEIANQKFNQLISDKGWLALEGAVQIGGVQGFGKRLSSILSTYLSEYDIEAINFDKGARNSKRQLLESKALDHVYPAYTTMLGHVRSKGLEEFKVRLAQLLNKGEGFASYVRTCTHSSMLEFDNGCADAAIQQANWDASGVREKLKQDIDAHASSVCIAKLSELNVNYEKQLAASLIGPIEALLETGEKDTWASIRKLLNIALSKFSTAVAEFELGKEKIAGMLQHLRDYSRNVVEKKAREEATKIMIHMKDRFSRVLSYDSDSKPRVWTGKEDIRSITKDARSASLNLLSVMAAIRLDEKPDNIEKVLFSSLMDGTVTVSSSQDKRTGASVDPLGSSTWEEVSSKDTLITPVQCKSLWRQFIAETENSVTQAISALVMVATVRCEEIANQKFNQLISDKGWLALEGAVQIGGVQGFGKRLSSILSTYLSEYDIEAINFDKGARNSKRQLLESKALDHVYPAYTTMLGHVRSKALEEFKVRLAQLLNKGEGFASYVRTCTHSSMLEFDNGCADAAIQQANWDASGVREKLKQDIDAHASSVCIAKLSELNVNYEKQLAASLIGPIEALLETGEKDTWASIRKLLNIALSKFSTAVAEFELGKEKIAGMLQHLRDYSRNVVEKKAREEATKIMIHMKDRFSRVLSYDSDSKPRVWTGKEDIRSITKDARSASLNLLSVMAAIRLDEKPDNIEKVLFSSLMDGTVTVSSSQDKRTGASVDPLGSSTWEEVSSKDTLITPVQCKSLWRQFIAETENSVTQAISALVMVATVRCEEIANQKFNQLISDKGWLALEGAVQIGGVQGFGKRLSSILSTYLSEYDIEAINFDKGARNSKRQLLESKALDHVYPAYTTMLGHVRSKALEEFKVRLAQLLNKGEGFASYVRTCTHSSMLEFDNGCADAAIQQANWDASGVREKLKQDIDAHASSVCIAKLSELNVNYEKQLAASLIGPIEALLETGEKDTWASIRKLLNIALSKFSTAVAEFELGKEKIAGMLQHLRDYSRNVVEKKAREEATKIMIHMKDRFSRVLSYDSDSKPRVWTGKEDIRSITKDARSASLNLLSVMAAIRLDEKPDNIEKVLFSSLMDGTVTVSSSQDKRTGASVDPLGSSTWEEVSSKDTLITPVQCKSLWRQFIAETENSVTQAISALVMVATVRCEEIANQKFNQLISDKGWLALEGAVQIGGVQGFGKRLSSILSTYLSEYDIEAINFDKGARNSKRQLLESKALDHVYPAYTTMLGHVRSKALEEFKVRLAQLLNKGEGFASYVRTCTHSSMLEFDNGCADAAIQQANWDASGVREKLKQDIDAHASSVCIAKLSELNVNYEKQLAASLIGPIEALLETGEKDTWASIRKLLNIALSKFSTAVAEFELGKEKIAGMLQHLRDYSRNVVEKKAREEATKIMIHMKDRFSRVLSYDSDSKPRVWTGKEDIRSITKDARSASLNLLSVMAAIRLDEKPDNIEKVLFSSLMDGTVTVSSSQDKRTGASVDPLGSSTWEEVSSKDTLITPVQCKSLWRQFIAETENSVTQAISALVMVATVRCEEIANQKFNQLISDKGWLALEGAVQIGGVQGFGKRLSSILSTYLSEYDIEAINFDKGARNSKRQLLESKALDHVYPAYTTMLGHVRSKALEEFKVRLAQLLNKGEGFASYVRTCTHSSMLEFDNGCADAAIQQANWDASGVREKLKQDIDAHASSVCIAKLSELNVNYEKQLAASLIGPIEALLETGEKDTWASIRKLLNIALSKFSTAVAEFELGKEKIAGMLQHLRDYSRNVVEKKAREEATKIMIHMKDRFSRVLSYDSDSKPRVWTGKEDIRSITKDARSASLNLLSVMAAIRLDEKPDNIEKVLFSSLMDGTVTVSSSQDKRTGASVDPLGSSTWEEVSSKDTLITPVQCKSLWRQFIAETENSVTQAISALVMVATVRCEEIANQKFNQLISDKGWLALEGAVQIGGVQGFGKRLSSILSTYLSEYDIEAINFDKGARNSKRQLLESKALDHVYPAYTTMLGHVRSKGLEEFKVRLAQLLNKGEGFASYVRTCTHSSMLEFDNGCADAAIQQANWDASGVREKLKQDIDAHASSVCIAKLSELNVNYEKQLAASLIGPIEALLETGEKDTWASIRKLLNIALSKFSTAVAEFELGKEKIAGMLQHLRDYSRNVVEKKAREEATKIMIHMKDRFSRVLSYDSDSKPRVWTGKEDIRSITKDARSASLNLLSVMAAIRLDEKPDNIEKVLFSSLMDGTVTVSSSQDKRTGASVDPLGSSTWEEVSSKDTLITPVQCKSLWRQFIAETENSVTQAISALVMVATVRCEEIANQKFNQLISDKGWLALEGAVQIGGVQGFGKRLSSILSTYLSEYDIEAINFDKGARNSKRQLLESKALDHVYPAYTTMLGHVRSKALEEFKVRLAQLLNKGEGFASYVRTCTHSSMLEFDNGCADAAIQQANWDASGVREKLKQDIDAHASSVCIAKLSELNVNYEKQLAASLIGPIEALLETGEKDTWASIRKLLNIALSKFSTAVAEFELGKEKIAGMLQHLRDYSRNVVEKKAREEATKIMIHMKDRFSRVLSYDSDSKPRVWTGKEDIRSITKDARSASLNLLSVMAAIRLDEKPDNIEKVLFSSLMDGTVTVSSSQDKRTGASVDPLGSSTWEEVSSKDTLITPVQCKSLWRQFIAETENSVTQAISALVMVATVRCEEIANQKFNQLISDKGWLALEGAVQIGGVQGFGKRLSSILSTYLSEYDIEAINFDKGARNSKRQLLESKALDHVYPAYTTMLGHVCSKALEEFKVRLAQFLNKGEGFASYVRTCTHSSMLEFDNGCADAAIQQANWDASGVREKIKQDIDAHASSVCIAKLSELNVNYEKQLSASLIGPIEALLQTGEKDTWASIRKLLYSETEVVVSKFSTVVAKFELDEETISGMLQHLRDYSRNLVVKKAREEATKIMTYMTDRFSTVFSYDSDSKPRVWTGKEDIRSITKDARSASLNLLSVMAAIRLDEKPDYIEKVLFSSLMDGTVTVSSSQDRRIGASIDPLGSSTWEEVSLEDTLITPVQCKSLWRQFIAETEKSVTQAISAQVMVATIRCEEIANEKFNQLIFDEGWLALEEAVQIGGVQGFGKRLSSILSTYLSEYDIEVINFDEGARNSKRQLLESKALDFVYPAYTTMLGHVHSKALENFKVRLEQSLNKGEGFTSSVRTCTQPSILEFDVGCADATIQQANWDATRVREKLQRDIDAHASFVCSSKLSELNVNYEKQLSASLTGPVEALLETGGKDTWASIRKLLNSEIEVAIFEFSTAVAEFELDKETIAEMLQHLRDYSRNVVEKIARGEAANIMIHMKDRFFTIFNYDSDSMPRVWTEQIDIRGITQDARYASLNLLSVMAAIRLDEKPDNIEKVLFSSLMDGNVTVSSSQDRRIGASAYPLASSTWEEVSSKDTLITPVQCKSLWGEFKTETEYSVIEAISEQEAYKQSNNWLPPPWATMVMVVHGFNQFKLLLK